MKIKTLICIMQLNYFTFFYRKGFSIHNIVQGNFIDLKISICSMAWISFKNYAEKAK